MLQSVLKNPLTVACSISVALVSCSSPAAQQSGRATRFLSVQPIQVCNDFGIFCADLALFEDATKKIWSQADLEIDFLSPVRLNAGRFLTIDSTNEFAELSFAGGPGAFGRHPLSSRTSGPLNMWFVETISTSILDSFGLAWIDQNGVLISDDILDFNNGIGRLDTVAHEIGHNLGLTHSNFGAGPANNLMSDGGIRNVPSILGDITPDGARLDRLTNDQIDFARASSLVTASPGPSPSSRPTGQPPSPPPLLDEVAYALDAAPPPGGVAHVNTWDADPFHQPEPPLDLATESVSLTFPEKNVLKPELALQGGSVNLPETAPSVVKITEAAPIIQQAARTDALLANRLQEPQKIPHPPAMSLISAGMLAGFLWRNRQSKRD